jgi:hypothetical protein
MKHSTRQQEKYNQLSSIEKNRVAQKYSKDLFLNAAKTAQIEVDDLGDDNFADFADAAAKAIEDERTLKRKLATTEPTPIEIANGLIGKVIAVFFGHLQNKPIYFALVLAVAETGEQNTPEIYGRYLNRQKQKSRYFEVSDEVLQEGIEFCHAVEYHYSIKHHAYYFNQDITAIKKQLLETKKNL